MRHRVPKILGRGLTRRGRQRAVPGFSPIIIPGCELWLRGDLGVHIVAGVVSVWDDQSGNGRNATSPLGIRPAPLNLPLTTIPAIYFNGVTAMILPNFGGVGPRTIIVVYQLGVLPAPADFHSLITLKNTTGEFTESITANMAGYEPYTFVSDFIGVPNSVGCSSILGLGQRATIIRYNGGLNTLPASYDFNNGGVTVPDAVSGPFGRVATDQASIGARVSNIGVLFFSADVYIAEIIVYDHALTASELLDIRTYLTAEGFPSGPYIDDGIGVVAGVAPVVYWNPGMHPGDLTLGGGATVQRCVNHLLPGTHDLVQPIVASQPIWTPAAWDATRAGIHADHIDDYLTANSLAALLNGNVPWNFFLAVNLDNIVGNHIFWSGDNGGGEFLDLNGGFLDERGGVLRGGPPFGGPNRIILMYRYDGAGIDEMRILTAGGELIVLAAGACPLVANMNIFFIFGYIIPGPISLLGCMRAGHTIIGTALTQANVSALAVYYRDSLDCPL